MQKKPVRKSAKKTAKETTKGSTRRAVAKKKTGAKMRTSTSHPKLTATKLDATYFEAGGRRLVLFAINAKVLWQHVYVNERDQDKGAGYQRVLSLSRVSKIKRFLEAGGYFPTALVLSLEAKRIKTDEKNGTLTLGAFPDAGWVIDGQHRLAGAYEFEGQISIPCVGIIDVENTEEIQQFVTINTEAKGVARSLYYDLLRDLPPEKSEKVQKEERATDIAREYRRNEDSVFFGRIEVVRSPLKGQISLTNFVRKVTPLLLGILSPYTLLQQTQILENYFGAIKEVFPESFHSFAACPVFKTVGFGAFIGVLPRVLSISLARHKNFYKSSAVEIVGMMSSIGLDELVAGGSGTKAEKQAAAELEAVLDANVDENDASASIVEL